MKQIPILERHTFQTPELCLSYLDSGGDAPILLCLHALWMQGVSFSAIAARLLSEWRIVALDQRGHGHSDRATDYSREAYVRDVDALLDHLEPAVPVVILGNSLGGTNGFQFAARHPEKVRALIIEEAPAREDENHTFILEWDGQYASRAAMAESFGPLFWSLVPSITEGKNGFHLSFDVNDMAEVQRLTNGNWWEDWLTSTCPALVIIGSQSGAVEASMMEEMADRRANTEIAVVEAGHVMHEDNPAATTKVIRDFLGRIPKSI